jgi:arylsulfatase A-like enzyme
MKQHCLLLLLLPLMLELTACKRCSEKSTSDAAPPATHALGATSAQPNIIVILLDTLRPDYLGFMGGGTETAPFLAQLAKKSAVFENALSTSTWTAPSTASLFTSLYPPQHTVIQGFKAHRANIAKFHENGDAEMTVNHIRRDLRTLPEVFKRAGYRTFGLTANINIGKEIGFDRGFDKFQKNARTEADEMLRIVKDWRAQIVKQKPFFLYLHFNDPHIPYNRREPFFKPARDVEGDPAARYRSEIGYLDMHLRKLWELPGLFDDALVVIVSDHGEEFMEHGGTEHGPTLYGELNRILFMLHDPSQGIVPGRYSQNVSLMDVMPTLADRIGQLTEQWEGRSLLPLFRPKSAAAFRETFDKRCLFGHRLFSSIRHISIWSVTCQNWKLIAHPGDRYELFDLVTDRMEQEDVSEKNHRIATVLGKRLETFRSRMARDEPRSEVTKIKLDKTLMKRLESLGYVEE